MSLPKYPGAKPGSFEAAENARLHQEYLKREMDMRPRPSTPSLPVSRPNVDPAFLANAVALGAIPPPRPSARPVDRGPGSGGAPGYNPKTGNYDPSGGRVETPQRPPGISVGVPGSHTYKERPFDRGTGNYVPPRPGMGPPPGQINPSRPTVMGFPEPGIADERGFRQTPTPSDLYDRLATPGMVTRPGTTGMVTRPGESGMVTRPGTSGMVTRPGTSGMVTRPGETPSGMVTRPGTSGMVTRPGTTGMVLGPPSPEIPIPSGPPERPMVSYLKKGGKVTAKAKAPVKKAAGGKVVAKTPVKKAMGGKVAAKPMARPVAKAKPMAKPMSAMKRGGKVMAKGRYK